MARPRTVSDEEVLKAARRCVSEHGPGVSLATIARELGVSAPALVRRFGSKEQLLFQALLPREPPRWADRLRGDPGDAPADGLVEILVDMCRSFEQVAPALAALRMSEVEVRRVFPVDAPGPPVLARRLLADWLRRAEEAGLRCGDPVVTAELLLGAVEARGFFAWVGPQMVEPGDLEGWVRRLVARLVGDGISPPSPAPSS